MSAVFDAFWRAAGYCLHPRVILWSLLPLLLAGAAAAALGWAFWDRTVTALQAALDGWGPVVTLLDTVESMGLPSPRTLLAPVIVVALAVPLIVVGALLLVATLMTPAIVGLVAQRRFPQLQRREGATWWQSLAWSLACTGAALLALLISVPLWLVPPLVLVLPPLIWGWLTYRVFAFDVLAAHATPAERRHVLREQHWPLLAIGVVCGYLGAVPSLLWAVSAATLVLAPLLVALSVWLYTLVFAFAACWFAHFALAALQRLRQQAAAAVPADPNPVPGALPPPP